MTATARRIENINTEQLQSIVGNNLRSLRQSRGYSQAYIAKHVDITFQQIQKYENAQNRLSADKLYLLANLFEVPLEAFFESLDIPEANSLDIDIGKLSGALKTINNRTLVKQLFNLVCSFTKDGLDNEINENSGNIVKIMSKH